MQMEIEEDSFVEEDLVLDENEPNRGKRKQ